MGHVLPGKSCDVAYRVEDGKKFDSIWQEKQSRTLATKEPSYTDYVHLSVHIKSKNHESQKAQRFPPCFKKETKRFLWMFTRQRPLVSHYLLETPLNKIQLLYSFAFFTW